MTATGGAGGGAGAGGAGGHAANRGEARRAALFAAATAASAAADADESDDTTSSSSSSSSSSLPASATQSRPGRRANAIALARRAADEADAAGRCRRSGRRPASIRKAADYARLCADRAAAAKDPECATTHAVFGTIAAAFAMASADQRAGKGSDAG